MSKPLSKPVHRHGKPSPSRACWPVAGLLCLLACQFGCQRAGPPDGTPHEVSALHPRAQAHGQAKQRLVAINNPAAAGEKAHDGASAVIDALREIAATPEYEARIQERAGAIIAAWGAVDASPPREAATMSAADVLAAYRTAARETLHRLPSYEGSQQLEISLSEFRVSSLKDTDQATGMQLREDVRKRLTQKEYDLAAASGVLDAFVRFPLNLKRLSGPANRTAAQAQEPPLGGSPATAMDHVRRGEMHLGRGDTQSALADFSEALKLDSQCTAALYRRAVMLARSRAVDEAVQDFTELQRIEPRFCEAPSEYLEHPLRSTVRQLILDAALVDLNAMNQLNCLRISLDYPTSIYAQTPQEAVRIIFDEDAEFDRELRAAFVLKRRAYALTEQAWDILERQFPDNVPGMLGILGVQRQILISGWPNRS